MTATPQQRERAPRPTRNAEPQYVGALHGLPAPVARRYLDLVPDAAITGPVTRWVYELARDLVDGDQDPHPTAVLRRARIHQARDARRPDATPTQIARIELLGFEGVAELAAGIDAVLVAVVGLLTAGGAAAR